MLNDINDFLLHTQPLVPEIRTEFPLVGKDQVKSLVPWKGPHSFFAYSESTALSFENVGFRLQQLDLYLQSQGLGVCWLGFGHPDQEHLVLPSTDADIQNPINLKFIMCLTFGNAKGSPHRELSQFKRKSLSEISDRVDQRLEPARVAPSGANTQPWYFLHNQDLIHVYCVEPRGVFGKNMVASNRISIGCALAHLYITNPNTFEFTVVNAPPELEGYDYVGSVKL
jgi:nitroreductase